MTEDANSPVGESVQVACFFVGDGEYGLDIMRIKEIIKPVEITKVPKAPPFVEGIVELRGAFLPIIDLRRRFDLPRIPRTRATKYIIVALEGRIVGLVVDRVAEVRRFAVDEICDAPELALGADARYFNGVVKWEDNIMMLLDLDAVFSATEKQQLRGMERAET